MIEYLNGKLSFPGLICFLKSFLKKKPQNSGWLYGECIIKVGKNIVLELVEGITEAENGENGTEGH